MLLNQSDKLRPQVFVHPPDGLEHLLRHIAQVALVRPAEPLFAACRRELTLTGPPEVYPDRVVDKIG